MATIVVRDAIPEAGIRHIQMLVEKKMGKRMKQRLLRETGGIKNGASVSYSASVEESKIDFRVSEAGQPISLVAASEKLVLADGDD